MKLLLTALAATTALTAMAPAMAQTPQQDRRDIRQDQRDIRQDRQGIRRDQRKRVTGVRASGSIAATAPIPRCRIGVPAAWQRPVAAIIGCARVMTTCSRPWPPA